MIDAVVSNPELFSLLRATCDDNNICVQICDDLLEGGSLREEVIKIIKIDEYYNSTKMHNPPPSIDCLIIIKTGENQFGLTLIELKNVSSAKYIKPSLIRPKFDTTIQDFLSSRFAEVFMNPLYQIAYFELWLVTNPYRWPPLSEDQYHKKVKGTALELYLSEKPYKFRDKIALIIHKPPDTEICL